MVAPSDPGTTWHKKRSARVLSNAGAPRESRESYFTDLKNVAPFGEPRPVTLS